MFKPISIFLREIYIYNLGFSEAIKIFKYYNNIQILQYKYNINNIFFYLKILYKIK